MDIALHIGLKPNVWAVCKHDIADRQEEINDFTNFEMFLKGDASIISNEECKQLEECSSALKFDVEFDLKVN